jgi:hypothetical protein
MFYIMLWTLLILSLPSDSATPRMRVWRSVKAAGAAALRDGVHLLPTSEPAQALFEAVAHEVCSSGGQAHVLGTEAPQAHFERWFDRTADWARQLQDVQALETALSAQGPHEPLVRALRRCRKAAEALAAIDFFPGEAQQQAMAWLGRVEDQLQRRMAPDEPQAEPAGVPRSDPAAFRGRVWATRARPWVDRLACAWLIRRHIDPQARFLWLARPADCPPHAVGFDFDGATFSHTEGRVSFETLLASFDLNTPALARLGRLVHALDVGGVMPPEAAGVAQVLAGMREAIHDDDQLLQVSAGVMEGLFIAFDKDTHR